MLLSLGYHQADATTASLGGQEMPGVLYRKEARVPGDQFYPVGRMTQAATRLQEVKGVPGATRFPPGKRSGLVS